MACSSSWTRRGRNKTAARVHLLTEPTSFPTHHRPTSDGKIFSMVLLLLELAAPGWGRYREGTWTVPAGDAVIFRDAWQIGVLSSVTPPFLHQSSRRKGKGVFCSYTLWAGQGWRPGAWPWPGCWRRHPGSHTACMPGADPPRTS